MIEEKEVIEKKQVNKGKIMSIVTSKLGTSIIVGFIAFNVGGIIATDTESPKIIESLQIELEEEKGKVATLEASLAEAQPFFAMKDAEKKALEDKTEKEKADKIAKEKADAEAEAKAQLEAQSVTLSNGNFEADVDFTAGTYDIVAVSGGGNVS